jgi:hypothetical protein
VAIAPEPARHVTQLRAFARVGSSNDRFQSHTADGTVPRADLADLRVHRTGVLDRLGTSRVGRLGSRAGLM